MHNHACHAVVLPRWRSAPRLALLLLFGALWIAGCGEDTAATGDGTDAGATAGADKIGRAHV